MTGRNLNTLGLVGPPGMDELDIDLVSYTKRIAILNSGEEVPITHLFDSFGDETNDENEDGRLSLDLRRTVSGLGVGRSRLARRGSDESKPNHRGIRPDCPGAEGARIRPRR